MRNFPNYELHAALITDHGVLFMQLAAGTFRVAITVALRDKLNNTSSSLTDGWRYCSLSWLIQERSWKITFDLSSPPCIVSVSCFSLTFTLMRGEIWINVGDVLQRGVNVIRPSSHSNNNRNTENFYLHPSNRIHAREFSSDHNFSKQKTRIVETQHHFYFSYNSQQCNPRLPWHVQSISEASLINLMWVTR